MEVNNGSIPSQELLRCLPIEPGTSHRALLVSVVNSLVNPWLPIAPPVDNNG
jgi:hypothetical protein